MKKILFLLAPWICMAFSCVPEESDTYHRTVKVTNNADYSIYITGNWVGQNASPAQFPWGSSGNKIAGGWNEKSEDRIDTDETNSTTFSLYGQKSIEGYLNVYNLKVFFIDATAYDQIPIGSPIPNEVLLDSRVYDLEALRAINFHIHYPLPQE